MLKSRTLAYDGRGNFVLRHLAQSSEAIATLGDRPLYAEKFLPFVNEVAVMVVHLASGEIRSYPAVETVHKNNICHLVLAPLRSRDPTLASRAERLAEEGGVDGDEEDL
jgi:phosphoribosylaminoimidazole carboxylase